LELWHIHEAERLGRWEQIGRDVRVMVVSGGSEEIFDGHGGKTTVEAGEGGL
jgi:hypothetical protein